MILRMARALHNKGHEPIFVRFNDKPIELLDEIARYAKIIPFAALLAHDSDQKIGRIDAIYCYTEDTLVRVLHHNKRIACPKILFGVFHTRQYQVRTRFGPSYLSKLYRWLFLAFPQRNIIFMSDGVRAECERHYGLKMTGANVLPLPVDVPPILKKTGKANRYKIVSIARLVEFKNYHQPIFEFIAKQRAAGLPFEYHIYGDGPLRSQLGEQARRVGVEPYIFFHGTLPYPKMGLALEDAGIFIGMGTAIIEAAACGIPAVAAIEMRGAECHGWFHETVGNSVGEQISDAPKCAIGELLTAYLSWSEQDYFEAGLCSWRRARDYSTDMAVDRFVDMASGAASVAAIRIDDWKWARFWAAKVYARYFTQSGWKHK